MKIIICGVGRVGLSIASYLSMQDNDITVIDANPSLVRRVSDTYDITGIVGHASEPEMLKKAGAEDADIIIAVTDCDEVNMVACQVAHSVFGINKKIARIRNKEYRDPAWSNLFSKHHMPIDVIISPEEEIAESILQRMNIPGTTNDMELVQDNVHVFGFIGTHDNELAGQTIGDLYIANREYDFRIISIIKNNTFIIPTDTTTIDDGDEIYVICEKLFLMKVLERLGNNNDIYSSNIVIAGGGVIGESLCEHIKNHEALSKNNIIIIENDIDRARYLNNIHKNILILNGSALNDDLLQEANVSKSSVFVSVMDSNENNILSSVLAKKMGAQYAIALNTNKLYNQLLPDRFIDAIVNPEIITVSRILHNLRHGHIQSVNSIRDTGYDLIEARVKADCGIVNVPFKELNLPKDISIIGIYCHETKKLIFPTPDTEIKSLDTVIILAKSSVTANVENLFSFSINLF